MQEEKTIPPSDLRAQSGKTLLTRLYRDVTSLIEEETALAKAEIVHRSGIAMVAARGFSLSMVCGLLALACLSACIIGLLVYVTAFWLAALIVAVVLGVVAFAAGSAARKALARVTEPASSTFWRFLIANPDGITLQDRQARVEWERKQIAQTVAALERRKDIVGPMRDTALGLGSLAVALNAIARSGRDQ
jgi:hypothetical protein